MSGEYIFLVSITFWVGLVVKLRSEREFALVAP